MLGLLLCAGAAVAEDIGPPGADHFQAGQQLYAAAAFDAAAEAFKAAADAMPGNDEYVYWLGKSYGRVAEQAGWFKAMEFARLTRESFERALAINPGNVAAMQDLVHYYEQAPGFLGGSAEKARDLRRRLADLNGADG